MAKIRGGEKATAYLKSIRDKIGDAPIRLQVGFLAGATYPDGTPVGLVAAVQNFGSPARGIPPRPFFSNMIADKSSTWGPALAKILPAVSYDVNVAFGHMGELIKGELQQSIRDTNTPPLSPITVQRKGFEKPLIDTAHMINSVDYKVTT